MEASDTAESRQPRSRLRLRRQCLRSASPWLHRTRRSSCDVQQPYGRGSDDGRRQRRRHSRSLRRFRHLSHSRRWLYMGRGAQGRSQMGIWRSRLDPRSRQRRSTDRSRFVLAGSGQNVAGLCLWRDGEGQGSRYGAAGHESQVHLDGVCAVQAGVDDRHSARLFQSHERQVYVVSYTLL